MPVPAVHVTPDTIWEFDVGISTHEHLQQGDVVLDYRRVIVLAEDYQKASLTAYALASIPDNPLITELLWRY